MSSSEELTLQIFFFLSKITGQILGKCISDGSRICARKHPRCHRHIIQMIWSSDILLVCWLDDGVLGAYCYKEVLKMIFHYLQ
ncbi:hypothetical protein DITRI_Ditri13aG0058400 [Diplodiscus trichospermus]